MIAAVFALALRQFVVRELGLVGLCGTPGDF